MIYEKLQVSKNIILPTQKQKIWQNQLILYCDIVYVIFCCWLKINAIIFLKREHIDFEGKIIALPDTRQCKIKYHFVFIFRRFFEEKSSEDECKSKIMYSSLKYWVNNITLRVNEWIDLLKSQNSFRYPLNKVFSSKVPKK